MSHLSTKQDNEMIFEKEEYNRLLHALISSHVAFTVSVLLVITTLMAWRDLGQMLSMTFLVLVGVIFIISGSAIFRFRPAVEHRRRIRDAIGGLVSELDSQLAGLEAGESKTFGTEGMVYYNVTRRGMGAWHIQVFNVGDKVTAKPMFEAITMKYRMAQVTDPAVAIRYTPYILSLVNSIHKVIADQCDGVSLVQLMSMKKDKETIEEIEHFVNRQS